MGINHLRDLVFEGRQGEVVSCVNNSGKLGCCLVQLAFPILEINRVVHTCCYKVKLLREKHILFVQIVNGG